MSREIDINDALRLASDLGWPAAAEALRTELSNTRELRATVESALDEILGTEEEDGAGQGLVADIWLVAEQRDEARSERDTMLPVVEAAKALVAQWSIVEDGSESTWPEREIAAHDALRAAVDALPAPETCSNCGNPIKRDPRGGWTHGGSGDDWQGKRCPGLLTGAAPEGGDT